MTLGALIERAGLDRSTLAGDVRSLGQPVTGVTLDSREVEPGHLFVAVRGAHADGAVFAGQARTRGAIAVVAETPAPDDVSSPWFTVGDGRRALAALAAAFHGDPSHELTVVGVTGTNGKTTTTYVAESILDRAGVGCGRIGSVSYRVSADAAEEMADRTTPEAPALHGLLRRMAARGCGACVMEVSSHALALRRVDGVRFGAAVFTNLTRDHLDFHGDMEAYFETKQRLFEMLPETAPAIINTDDPRGPALVARCPKPVTYALDTPADVAPARAELTLDGLALDVRTPRGTLHLTSRLLGRNNAYNVLAATAAAVALDVSFQAIEEGVRALEAVPGRMEVVSSDADDITVLVDFAHTDAALRGLLETVRPPRSRQARHGVRLWRRPGRDETAAHGRGRRAAQRSGRPHVGQSAVRGSRRHPARDRTGVRRGPWRSTPDRRSNPCRHHRPGPGDRALGLGGARVGPDCHRR